MRNLKIVTLAVLLLCGVVGNAHANPFVHEKRIRMEIEKTIWVDVKAPGDPEPEVIPVDMDRRGAAYRVPCNGRIRLTYKHGKPPEVRGKRSLEGKRVIIRYKRMGPNEPYKILAQSDPHHDNTYEVSIPLGEYEPGDRILVEINYDLEEEGFDLIFLVSPYTLQQMREMRAAAEAAVGRSVASPSTPPVQEERPVVKPRPTPPPSEEEEEDDEEFFPHKSDKPERHAPPAEREAPRHEPYEDRRHVDPDPDLTQVIEVRIAPNSQGETLPRLRWEVNGKVESRDIDFPSSREVVRRHFREGDQVRVLVNEVYARQGWGYERFSEDGKKVFRFSRR